MKKQSRRAQTRSSPPLRHQLEHVVPTVIHDPEEKMTALGRFTHHAVKEPRRYLGWPAAIIACVFLAVVVWKLATGGRSPDEDAWAKLETAKSAEERVDLAKEFPTSPVATWALLQAATEYYNLALSDLPQNRDVALPTARKALDLFEQVEREAPHDSPQARSAALGKARTLEMRNDLSQALEQYQHVVKEWPESSGGQGRQAPCGSPQGPAGHHVLQGAVCLLAHEDDPAAARDREPALFAPGSFDPGEWEHRRSPRPSVP